MAHLVRGRLGLNTRPLRPLVLNLSRVNYSSLNYNQNGTNRHGYRRRLLQQPPTSNQYINTYRAYGMLVARILRGALKLRYLVLGGAVGGGAALSNKYEQWKEGLPDMKWLDEVLPDSKQWAKFSQGLMDMSSQMKDSIQIDPRLKQLTEDRMAAWRAWFDSRLDNAIKAAETGDNTELDSSFQRLSELVSDIYGVTKEELKLKPVNAKSADDNVGATTAKKHRSMQQQIEQLQAEIMGVQLKYQRELEKLEKENKSLRQQFLLMKTNRKSVTAAKKIKKSLIDMYSEVLDELSGYDTSYQTADHLPRVVVVGDQSSGKTSVLEAIAQARIFPRGSGEMMTRAPVKVTLAEGPYHVASFRGSDREYDLTKESELADLRREVEFRMRNSVRGGKTVSTDVISMTVKGPGLQRMVLVDLPGIISTVTVDMAHDTKDSIQQMTKHYMSNPNAIILCIQDGSVDAERSNVTDFVTQCDPLGKRTIFVLTKVDLAEELADPDRIRRILAGKLFPMRALGYYAVVTGRGRKDDTIETIRDYEENFFKTSKLFQKSGAVMPHQVTTRNLSLAVADRFWKMVSESIEQQADAFKATRFNLETEWKNQFPKQRITSRDELFEKAKGEILDQIINLSQISPKQWDETFEKNLWEKISSYVFENIYLHAAQSQKYSFNTLVDIKLREWAEQSLPAKSVECGWEGLQQVLLELIEKSKDAPENDDTFDNVKSAVVDETIRRHTWEDKAVDMLRVIQLNVLEDSAVHSKSEWDQAVNCFESFVRERLQQNDKTMDEMFGPSSWQSWIHWRYTSEEQTKRRQIKSELDKILSSDKKHAPTLSYDELTTVRKNLQRSNLEVEPEFIREVWYPVYRKHFLNLALSRAHNGKKAYYLYTTQGADCPVDCSDIILFWRIQQMVKVTATALRQQVINREAKRLDKEIKEVLDEFGDAEDKKVALLATKRVTLAEEIIRVRQIQEKLEEFINALNKEK